MQQRHAGAEELQQQAERKKGADAIPGLQQSAVRHQASIYDYHWIYCTPEYNHRRVKTLPQTGRCVQFHTTYDWTASLQVAYKEALHLSKDDPLPADRLSDCNFGLVRAHLAVADVSATSRAGHDQNAVSSEPFSYGYSANALCQMHHSDRCLLHV